MKTILNSNKIESHEVETLGESQSTILQGDTVYFRRSWDQLQNTRNEYDKFIQSQLNLILD